MAAKCFTVTTTSSLNSIPRGYSFKVVSDHLSPLSTEVEKALIKEGFAENHAHALASHSSYWKVEK